QGPKHSLVCPPKPQIRSHSADGFQGPSSPPLAQYRDN
ncbi:hypothetical protein PoMZ_12207, partial [Pyricularia oryzae]